METINNKPNLENGLEYVQKLSGKLELAPSKPIILTTKQLFIDSERIDLDSKWDNGNRAVRNIDTVLKQGIIDINITKKGKVWTGKNNKQFNLKIKLIGDDNGYVYYGSDLNPEFILSKLAKFFQREEVREQIKNKITVSVKTPCKCGKCDGVGVIPAFYYYANGICFDCMGIGFTSQKTSVKLQSTEKGVGYIHKFYITGNFTEKFPLKNVKAIKPVEFIGHPTAETFLGESDNFFWIYAPVCERNDWYKIPKAEMGKFTAEWNKNKSRKFSL